MCVAFVLCIELINCHQALVRLYSGNKGELPLNTISYAETDRSGGRVSCRRGGLAFLPENTTVLLCG